MSCYHPLAGVHYHNEFTETGAKKYHIFGSYDPELKKLILPEYDPVIKLNQFADVIKVPCGHCIGCALDQARRWSDRMILEFMSSGKRAIFVTLTYNNDHVPMAISEEGEFLDFSLCKRDLQLFFKRLRRRFPNRTLRFYACGELGGQTGRPHYHAIIFGIGLCDFPDRTEKGMNELGQKYYISDYFGKIWSDPKDMKSIGFHILSDVSYKTCSYVARYCMKKIVPSFQVKYGEQEFHLMSRRPGLGKTYLDMHPDLFGDQDNPLTNISIFDGEESKQIFIPKYFYDKLKVEFPELYDKLGIQERSSLMSDKELIKLQKTDLGYLDMLELEENKKLDKTKILFTLREKV